MNYKRTTQAFYYYLCKDNFQRIIRNTTFRGNSVCIVEQAEIVKQDWQPWPLGFPVDCDGYI